MNSDGNNDDAKIAKTILKILFKENQRVKECSIIIIFVILDLETLLVAFKESVLNYFYGAWNFIKITNFKMKLFSKII